MKTIVSPASQRCMPSSHAARRRLGNRSVASTTPHSTDAVNMSQATIPEARARYHRCEGSCRAPFADVDVLEEGVMLTAPSRVIAIPSSW